MPKSGRTVFKWACCASAQSKFPDSRSTPWLNEYPFPRLHGNITPTARRAIHFSIPGPGVSTCQNAGARAMPPLTPPPLLQFRCHLFEGRPPWRSDFCARAWETPDRSNTFQHKDYAVCPVPGFPLVFLNKPRALKSTETSPKET